MKTITTSILALAVAAPMALADTPASTDGGTMMNDGKSGMSINADNLIRSRDIVGGRIYTTNEAQDEGWEIGKTRDEVGSDWNVVGEIEDVVLSKDGKMIGVVGEVGGFLDIGDKHVLIPVDDVNLVASDEYALVTRLNEEDLEALENVDEGFWE